MNLQQTFEAIGNTFNLDAEKLQEFAAQDKYTGWDAGEGEFPCGSLWTVEGQVLYALIRLLKPKNVLELGVHHGASTCHIASALQKNRPTGQVTSVDLAADAGHMIPASLTKRVALVNANGLDVLEAAPDNSLDLIFEDMDHSFETGKAVAELVQAKLKSGGFLVVHDAMHWLVGRAIRNGLLAGHIVPEFYEIEPSDCGLAIWQKPEE